MTQLWACFKDGKRGVQERFLHAICCQLVKFPNINREGVAHRLRIDLATLEKLVDKVDQSEFSHLVTPEVRDLIAPAVIEPLSESLFLDTRECYQVDLGDDMRDVVKNRADKENFYACVTVGDEVCPEDDRLELYLIMRALDAFHEATPAL